MRVSVLVSGGGANLQPLLDVYRSGTGGAMEISAVISSVDGAGALERAKAVGVPIYLVERALFPNSASFCSALLNKLRDLDTDLVVCAGFTEKLNYLLLRYYKNRVISVQPVLFPAFCTGELDAMRAVKRMLDLGVRFTGATSYFMSDEDNGYGPIIVQKIVEVLPADTVTTLSERIMRQGEWSALTEAVKLYCEGKLQVSHGKVLILEPGA
ncbi:MAG: phosphoribosylglycinamide formyltransferase [Oscillospiraceae bacterium]|nr:phosphoribosylglycinamide formyltransferase [Oscillospiraceae bacterium]